MYLYVWKGLDEEKHIKCLTHIVLHVCNGGLLLLSSLTFCMTEKVFISTSFLKEMLLVGIEFEVDFFPLILKKVAPACIISDFYCLLSFTNF